MELRAAAGGRGGRGALLVCDTTAVRGGGGEQTGNPTQQGTDGQKHVSCICCQGDMASAL